MAFASLWRRPAEFGEPGFAVKSSISLLRRKPAPATTTADLKLSLIVVVRATAFPAASVTQRWVVWVPWAASSPTRTPTFSLGVACGAVDRRALAFRPIGRGELGDRVLHEIGIPKKSVPRRERAAHRLDPEVDRLGRLAAEARQVVVPKNVTDHREGDPPTTAAASTRRAARGTRTRRARARPGDSWRDRRR